MSARAEFRRGWTVLLGAAVGVAVGISSLPFYTSGVFLKELEAEFGWSRAALSAGTLVSTLGLATASPFVGAAVDRYGIRRPVAFSLIGLALGFVAMALTLRSLIGFWLIQAAMAVAGAASAPTAYTRAVNGWFDRARGLALGIALMGTGVAAALAPLLVTRVIEQAGWRQAYLALAAVVVLALPIILTMVRLGPAEAGGGAEARGMSFDQARATRVFWLLALAFFALSFAVSGLIVHFVPLLTDAGTPLPEAAATAGVIGLSVIAGRLGVGFLSDRFFAPHVAAGAFLLCAAGCLLLATGGASAALPAAMAIGFAIGAEVDLIGYLAARYFGLRAYGRVYGWHYGAFILGTGASPVWIGAVYDSTGRYGLALYAVSAILAAVAMLFAMLPRFEDKGEALA